MKIYCHHIFKMPYPFCGVGPSIQSPNHEDGPKPELVVIFTVLSIVCLRIVEDFIAVEKNPKQSKN